MLDYLTQNMIYMADATKAHLPFLGLLLLFLFIVLILTRLSGKRLLWLGIIPRRLIGLPGIIFSPFLHADFNHFFFNAIPLVILSNFILFYGFYVYFLVSALIIVMSGVLTWLFAKPGIHVGASGVITGYWGLLVINSYQQASFMSIVLGIVSIYYFAGIFFGIFPSKQGVSWEGHLFGLIAGVCTSYLINSPLFLSIV